MADSPQIKAVLDTKITGIIAALLLFGIFFLELNVPIMIALVFTGTAFIMILSTTLRIDKIGLLVLLNYSYWLWSGLMFGAFTPMDLASNAFLNGDGRIFVSYIPLLFFSVVAAREHNLKSFHRVLLVTGFLSVLLFIVWIPTHLAILSEGAAGNFVGFLTSHTGGGTFFGIISVLLILYGHQSQRVKTMMAGCLVLLPMLGSGSRESLVACLAVVVWYLIKIRHWRSFVYAALLFVFVISATSVLAPKILSRTYSLFTWDIIDNIITTVQQSDWGPGDGEEELHFAGKQVNILFRITIWVYAIKRFLDSPLIGIGFGRYNDHNLHMSGYPGLVYIASDGHKVIGTSNAHNSYVHVLCESGLFGLILFMSVWATVYLRLGCGAKRFALLKDVKAFAIACQGVVIFSLVAALTGHALAAPSLGIPAMTAIGMAIAYLRTLDKSTQISISSNMK